MVLVGSGLGARMMGVFANVPLRSGDQVYSVVGGDTLGGIATRYHTTWQRLASYNHIANPNIIYMHQTICIPGKARPTRKPAACQSPLSKALAIIFLTASVHGGQVIVIFNYTVFMCHGKRKQMPGNGQPAQETSTGIFLALLRKARLLTCNHG